MYPFWKPVIEPIVRASGAQRLLEIGALRGETTVKMLEDLGAEAELHVIDPVPAFDPAEHERRFEGRYVFHRDLSLNVLPSARAFDLALVDGDHNWYTVYNELRLLREASRREGRPLPVLILHDVCWPYGRRDLYYEPSQIPEEFRQPYARRGMRPDRKKLLNSGGMNITLDNAEVEGGPRNGVMTALEDFLAEHDAPYRLVVLPIYFGLAIVVEQARLDLAPALAGILDHLESPAGKDETILLAERIRIDEQVFEHNWGRVRDERLARANARYLDLLRAALLDEHYLENEARIEYLLGCARRGVAPKVETLRDPRFPLRKELRALRQRRAGGEPAVEGAAPAAHFPYTDMGAVQLRRLHDALEAVRTGGVTGDLVECGVGRGGGAIYARGFLEAHEDTGRTVWVVDRFVRPSDDGGVPDDGRGDLNDVRDGFARFGLLDERVRFLQGDYAATLDDAPIGPVAVLRIGASTGSDAGTVLDRLYDRVEIGGVVLVHDDGTGAVLAAVDDFRARRGVDEPAERVGIAGTAWIKEHDGAGAPDAPVVSSSGALAPARAPLAPPPPADAVELSVVVVFYDMAREAARTLHSLSRSYQEGIDDLAYEVLVVDNGSSPGQRLDAAFVAGFGPEFRLLDLGGEATPSPTTALNRAIAAARGRNFALMIDGAHVLTPGVLRNGMAGLGTYGPAVVATQQWYVGPGQQPAAVTKGYDRAEEDRLFESIGWPVDGYRLFEIGHFIGDRDWFDGMWESNCLFVPRQLLEQVGGFDDGFSMPGGGYANLDLYERLAAAPGVTPVTILGEGSFHQVHGGTTTNDGEADDRRTKVFGYGDHYRELRGRPLSGPPKPIHYVGALTVDGARRTRSRRLTAAAFSTRRITEGPDGRPSTPAPMPDDLRTAFVEAYWQSLAWKETRWLGRRLPQPPTDLVAYQELLAQVRPDWIVETGTGGGGRALFLASICDLLDHGHVVSVGGEAGTCPEHPRITSVHGAADEPATVEQVLAVTGADARALVILGSAVPAPRLVREFDAYRSLVPVGSYVVVERTIVNGRPVWPGYGPGPFEAVRQILGRHGDFVQDTTWERHGLTFNPGGFLRRVR